jgi:hypothetical protein
VRNLQHRLQKLELRVREEKLSSEPPGYALKRLMERLDQIRSRIPPEQLLAYQSEANAEQRQRDMEEIRARLRAVCGRPEEEVRSGSAADKRLRRAST